MKNKITAGILALFLGGIGIHKFYLDRPGQGILYLLFCWTFIPMVIAFVEGIIYLTMSDQDFNAKYNTGITTPAPTTIPAANGPTTTTGRSVADELKELRDLRENGELTEDEFQAQRRRLLGSGV